MHVLFGRYEYVAELGQGSGSRVLHARDLTERGAARALKVVGPEQGARLAWELSRLSEIAHPNVARVRELLRVDEAIHAPFALVRGAWVLVMDLAPGEPADRALEVLRDDPRALLASIFRIATGCAEGLAALHRAGLVHGDVKPSNLLCTRNEKQITLIDLGAASTPGFYPVIDGTPDYLAPETWTGHRSFAQDVYALGATLFDLMRGDSIPQPSEPSLVPWRVPHSDSLSDAWPEVLVDLLRRMLHTDPEHRPSDASRLLSSLHAVGKRLHLGVPRSATSFATGRVLPSAVERSARALGIPFVGHRNLRSQLIESLRRAGVVLIVGPSGSGRTRLLREAVRELQVQSGAEGREPPSLLNELSSALATDLPYVIVHEVGATQDALREAQRAVSASRRTGRRLTVVFEQEAEDASLEAAELTVFNVGPLDLPELRVLLNRVLDVEVQDEVAAVAQAVSGGYSGRLCVLLSNALAEGRSLLQVADWSDLSLPVAPLGSLSADAHGLAEVLAIAARDLSADAADKLLPGPGNVNRALQELGARGLLGESEGGALSLLESVARAMRAGLGARLSDLAAKLRPLLPPEHSSIWVWIGLAEMSRATELLRREVEIRRRRGDPRAAVAVLREVLPWLDAEELRCMLADALRALGQYEEASEVLAACTTAQACLLLAEVERLRGRPESATLALTSASHFHDGAMRERAQALEARVAFDRGELDRAAALVAILPSDAAARLRAREVRLLSHFQAGHVDTAEVRELLSEARRLGDPRSLSRSLMLAAQADARAGQLNSATESLREALVRSREAGEVHESASIAINLGLLEIDAGLPGRALRSLREGAFALTLLGREPDLARALYNLANAAWVVGDVVLAEVTLGEARALAKGQADPSLARCLTIMEAEIALHRGAIDAALHGLTAELSGLAGGELLCVLAARGVCAAVAAGDFAQAETALTLARANLTAGDPAQEAELAVAGARLSIATGQVALAEQTVAGALDQHADRLVYETHLRLLFAGIDSARSAGLTDRAEQRLRVCRGLLERALLSLESDARAMFRALPAHARVLSQGAASAASTGVARGTSSRALVVAARRMLQATSEARLARVSCQIALEMVQAERALLVTQAGDGRAQTMASASLTELRDAGFSRSIVERVWSDMTMLSAVDALHDKRLDAAQSVHALGVRSVVAAPVRGFAGRTVLYLDDALRAGAFGAAERELIADLCELISVAARNVTVLRAERRAALRAQRQARGIAAESSRTDPPVEGSPLVGQSRALQLTLQLSRRVAVAGTPVLIQGESGTGKELLARFVHAESERRDKPFVAESCAALPESLLESTLFGHERGAFTGADRARAGLFESAHHGTLFLDEVAEMSPALQAKLLRVLQDGEVRPVGSEKTRHVDVRLLTATHRDLSALVREGRFRQDLFYRMAVVTLELPALRERLEDIPLLVEAFLRRHAPKRKVRISAEAMQALKSRDWPGNVRQLESEIQRALALSEGTIELEHLSPIPEQELAYGLDLRSHTDALQRKLVRRALDDCAGNQTRAAEALGISRFGLLKMLKRLGMQ